MRKITITRALSELKTLKSRYEREIRDAKLIGVSVSNKMLSPYSSYTPADFGKQALATYQSISDLDKLIIQIKTKIDQSNFITKVKIGGNEMTVLEAIQMKNHIDLKESMLLLLKRQLKNARTNYEGAECENKERVEKSVSDQTGAGNKDKELEATIKESIDKVYPIAMIDPLNVETKIKELEEFIENFKSEVDFVLSESNSLTYIEVDD
jgi:lipopolysaccharide export LptBFGC system permease protein LptF